MRIAAGAGPELAERGGVGVILESGWELERLVHVIAHRDIAPRFQVWRIQNDAGWNVHGAWRGNADRGDIAHLQTRRSDSLANRLAHAFQPKLLAAMGFGRQAYRCERFASVINDARFHRGAADIEADE